MEKYKALLLGTVIFLSISLSSCEKKPEKIIIDEKISQLDIELKQINSGFSLKNIFERNKLASIGPSGNIGVIKKIPRLMSFKTFSGILSADVGGAWAGSWAGGKIGGWAGPKGATAGAIIGAVVIGGAASYSASYSILDRSSLINHSLETEEELIINIDTAESAYDGHNRVLISLINANRTDINELIINTDSSSLNSSDVFTNLSTDELNFLNSNKTLVDKTLETFKSDLVDINISKNYVNSIINDDNYLTTVSDNFFDGLKFLSTKTDILDYINQYESYIINTTNLNEIRKQQILIALEVSRSSLDFWAVFY